MSAVSRMTFDIETVTPAIAGAWLEKNEGNRRLREPRAAMLARAITDDKYRLTHQAIAFSPKGRLLDGQHRLRAVCLANKAIEIVVARNVPESAFSVMDAGMSRQMYERLRSNKVHTSVASTLLKMMTGKKLVQDYEVELAMDLMGPALLKLDQIPNSATRAKNTKKSAIMSRATQISAVALRMALAIRDRDEDAQLRINWKLEKIRYDDMVGAPPIIVAYSNQLTVGVQTLDITVSAATDSFVRAWRAFDPGRELLQRLQIDDHSVAIKEAREVFHELSEGCFDP